MVKSWKHSPRMMTILWPCFKPFFWGECPMDYGFPIDLGKPPPAEKGDWDSWFEASQENSQKPTRLNRISSEPKKTARSFQLKRNVSLVFSTSTSTHEHWMRSAVQSLNRVQWSCQRWFVIFLSSVPWVCIETYLCTLPHKAHKFHV